MHHRIPAFLLAGLSLVACSTRSAPAPGEVRVLDASDSELRDAFNAADDRTRLLLILSPT
jgi:hypothetical protein